MHYLVTGGCGFIGSHLVELLIKDGHHVTVIDDLSTGKRENLNPDANFIHADITTPGIFDNIVHSIDGCFHLAAIVSVEKSAFEWQRTHHVNLGGTIALFDALVRHKLAIPVVFASSAAAYGDKLHMPLKEDILCTPSSAYGADKLGCELHANIATQIHNIPTIGLRFFNIYGTRQDATSPYSSVISIFANRIKQNLPISIFGDGFQTRDFTYVEDISVGLLLSMQALEKNTIKHGLYNLSTGIQTSINDLAKMLMRMTGQTTPIIYKTSRLGDVKYLAGCTELSRKYLNFQAKTTLEKGLLRILKN